MVSHLIRGIAIRYWIFKSLRQFQMPVQKSENFLNTPRIIYRTLIVIYWTLVIYRTPVAGFLHFCRNEICCILLPQSTGPRFPDLGSRVYDNFKCLYKKAWKLIECTTYIYIYIYIYTGCALGVKAIENGHGDPSSNPRGGWLHLT